MVTNQPIGRLELALRAQPPGFHQAPRNHFLALLVPHLLQQVYGDGVVGFEPENLFHQRLGRGPIRLRLVASQLDERVYQLAAHQGVAGVELMGLPQAIQAFETAARMPELLRLAQMVADRIDSLQPLAGFELELAQLGVVRARLQGVSHQLQRLLVVAGLQAALGLADPAYAGFLLHAMLMEALFQTLDVALQTRQLAVDGFHQLPLIQSFAEALGLLQRTGFVDDRAHQLLLFPNQADGLFEVLFTGRALQSLLEDLDPTVQVGLGVGAAVRVGDESQSLLAPTLADVKTQRLEQSVVGELGEIAVADRQGVLEVLLRHLRAGFGIRVTQGLALGLHLALELVVNSAAAVLGRRAVLLQGQKRVQLVECGLQVARLPMLASLLVVPLLLRLEFLVGLRAALHPPGFVNHAQRLGIVGAELQGGFQRVQRVADGIVLRVLSGRVGVRVAFAVGSLCPRAKGVGELAQSTIRRELVCLPRRRSSVRGYHLGRGLAAVLGAAVLGRLIGQRRREHVRRSRPFLGTRSRGSFGRFRVRLPGERFELAGLGGGRLGFVRLPGLRKRPVRQHGGLRQVGRSGAAEHDGRIESAIGAPDRLVGHGGGKLTGWPAVVVGSFRFGRDHCGGYGFRGIRPFAGLPRIARLA